MCQNFLSDRIDEVIEILNSFVHDCPYIYATHTCSFINAVKAFILTFNWLKNGKLYRSVYIPIF